MALPPGPPWPPALQTAAWITRPGPFMERARRRYGDAFTVRLAQVGTFVFTTDPDELKGVFTARPDRLRAARDAAAHAGRDARGDPARRVRARPRTGADASPRADQEAARRDHAA